VYDDLIRAFALVRSHSDARLLILGEGGQRAMLTELVGAMGLGEVVDLPGRVANPHAYMAQANLFVLSSRYEGFGNVLVEAMACGCPIVATNCLGGPVDILERGRWGGLAPVGDIKALAQGILDALSRPKDAAGLRQRAMDFHVDKIADRYCEVLGLTTAPAATG
jgi:glycosyltransferase involved in cell wall biosynthesis